MNWLSLPGSLKGRIIFFIFVFVVSNESQKELQLQILLFLVSFRCKLAQANGWGVMVSHRSGETEDTIIADLVVGLCTGQVNRHQTLVDNSVSLLL